MAGAGAGQDRVVGRVAGRVGGDLGRVAGRALGRRTTAGVLALVVLAGCTSGGDDDTDAPGETTADRDAGDGAQQPAAEADPDPEPEVIAELTSFEDYLELEASITTLGQQLAAAEDDDGTLPLQASLDLYAAVIGPIPGGESSNFTLDHRVSGTTALRRLLPHLDDLDADQRAVVDDLLALDDVQTIAAGGEGEIVRVVDVPTSGEVARLAAEMRGLIGARLGRDLGITLVTSVLDRDESSDGPVDPNVHGGTGWAQPQADGLYITSGRADACVIGIFPQDGSNLRTVVVHEVFHCFQYAMVDDVADILDGQSWIVEGQASWAEVDLLGPASDTPHHYRAWLCTSPALTSRSYDAIGFYTTLESLGISPWRVFEDMLGLEGADAVAATGVDVETMLRRIATSRYRDDPRSARFGDEWRFVADGAEGVRDCVIHLRVGADVRQIARLMGTLAASPPFDVVADGDVLVYDLTAPIGDHAFAEGGARGVWTTETRGMHCLLESCGCPDGGPAIDGSDEEWPLALAFTTQTRSRFSGELYTIPLDEACEWPVGNVTIEIHGLLEQTLIGGVCIVEEGFLHVHAGWNSSNARDQGPPHPDANGLIVTLAEEGTSPVGHPTLLVWGDESGSILYKAPSTTRHEGLLTGTFEGEGVHGSWSCPEIEVSDRPASDELEEERRRILEGS